MNFLEFRSDFFGVASPSIALVEDERRVVLAMPNGSATNVERLSTVCAHLSGARCGPPGPLARLVAQYTRCSYVCSFSWFLLWSFATRLVVALGDWFSSTAVLQRHAPLVDSSAVRALSVC
jgi:hypothetical protein